ncbi:hypothetical protein C1H46_027755 [Malus baccata]|uniref:Uncharacterized protein n=1 Tax=Malus baccata TaxID=106549 RepID=A0A540LK96_MALBA|nr:hypothetical protein C1H46_027755 [Malus baccata]
MKGLFKSKPRTPADIVRQTRDLLVYAQRAPDSRESKREEKAQKDATQVVANLQRQQVQSKLIASDYFEANIDLMDVLIQGYGNTDMALHYGAMLRECIRHQSVARYVLETNYE